MKKQDRALKAKGFRQVPGGTGVGIETKSVLKDKKGKIVRVIYRTWKKPDH